MDELTAFLKARLDEDEAAAYGLCGNGAHMAKWLISGDGAIFIGTDPPPEVPIARAHDERVAQWIAHHDPARVLREVAAKRAIVAAWLESEAALDRGYSDVNRGGQLALRTACRHLAAAWEDHPDYREDWRPS